MAEVAVKDVQEETQPNPVLPGYSRGVTATMACLAGLLVIGAAVANSLPNLEGFSLPSFDRFTFPKLDSLSLPHFNLTSVQKPAATPPQEAVKPVRETVTVPIPDPAVTTALTDIQASQRQHTIVLASLTQSADTQQADLKSQQADLKRISRQLSSLAVQVEALAPPLTTSSIGHPPLTTSSIPRQYVHPRARIIRTPRKTESPKADLALPPPVGPVSVGGAPLSPAPAPVPAPVSVSSAK